MLGLDGIEKDADDRVTGQVPGTDQRPPYQAANDGEKWSGALDGR